jgi:hypothetical protein
MKLLPYLNAITMMGASAGFLVMALVGLDLHRDISGMVTDSMDQSGDQLGLILLGQFRREQFFRLVGSSCLGAWALVLSLTRFRVPRFPAVAMLLLMASGPALVFFNWYDPDHIARTGAIAGVIIGTTLFSVRLINKGIDD